MTLMVYYVRELTDPHSESWPFNPLRADLAGALAVAREGYARSEDYVGATGFRIVDEAGATVAEERRTSNALVSGRVR